MDWSGQDGAAVRVEWGPLGAQVLASGCAALVIVDVLSFTTCVTVAVERGIQVYPYAWRDETAQDFADEMDAVLAMDRGAATVDHPWSLSPAALTRAPHVPRLVLPSPNGSAIAAAAGRAGKPVLAASLRNASAVGRWLVQRGYGTADRPLGIVPAGERWPDGSLRPAIEDALGAAAVLATIEADSTVDNLSAEAYALRSMHGPRTAEWVRDCASARELVQHGFADDVAVAADVDACTSVPMLREGAFATADESLS
jgi:2-phosphosulfolactate phosphatase